MVDYIQQPHAIDVLLALFHIPNPRWNLVKEYILKVLKASSISDHSYRCRCKELVKLGLAKAVKRDSIKNDYHLTQLGRETAKEIEPALQKVERWRKRALKTREVVFKTKL